VFVRIRPRDFDRSEASPNPKPTKPLYIKTTYADARMKRILGQRFSLRSIQLYGVIGAALVLFKDEKLARSTKEKEFSWSSNPSKNDASLLYVDLPDEMSVSRNSFLMNLSRLHAHSNRNQFFSFFDLSIFTLICERYNLDMLSTQRDRCCQGLFAAQSFLDGESVVERRSQRFPACHIRKKKPAKVELIGTLCLKIISG
jgi:hypothetical protein